jgi:SecD/SecF fusion protein
MVKDALLKAFPDRIDGDPKLDQVGAVFGKQLAVESLYAVLAGLVAIFIYLAFRFEFSFAVGTIVALFHDVTVAVGITLLLGYDLSIIHIGAILTVAGYSVNDTIVVFDRIREALLTTSSYARPKIKDVMNLAISQTLSRTILTTSTTLFCIVVMLAFGGPALKDFSLPLLAGVITGAYSTIFIAAPIALWWSRRKGRDLESEIHAREEALRAGQEAEV